MKSSAATLRLHGIVGEGRAEQVAADTLEPLAVAAVDGGRRVQVRLILGLVEPATNVLARDPGNGYCICEFVVTGVARREECLAQALAVASGRPVRKSSESCIGASGCGEDGMTWARR